MAVSLARLTGEEQKAVKTTAFDLQLNPASPGMSFHKLDKARDKNFWSVRVNADIRLIVHKTPGSLLLCYVDHHDKAYDWAERRKLQTHPKTGAAQLVEIRETVQQIVVPKYVETEAPKPAVAKRPLFAQFSKDDLLGYGVPAEWLDDVLTATDDVLLGLVDHLPREAAEALLELAIGGKPRKPQTVGPAGNPFEHPDAQRRFRVMSNVEELQRALDFPWEKWTVFLHPEQRQWIERDYSGPARVTTTADRHRPFAYSNLRRLLRRRFWFRVHLHTLDLWQRTGILNLEAGSCPHTRLEQQMILGNLLDRHRSLEIGLFDEAVGEIETQVSFRS